MADRTRTRRNPPPQDNDTGQRRRRSGASQPQPRRPRSREAGDPPPADHPQATNPAAAEPNRSTPVATEVTLPQLGESVTEGTITAWLAEVGDNVEADQPLFELSSDKIDTEVPAPTSGVLTEIKVQVDETVDVGTVVALIGEQDEAGGDGQAPPAEDQQAEDAEHAEGAQQAEGAEPADDTGDEDTGGQGKPSEPDHQTVDEPTGDASAGTGTDEGTEGQPESASGPELEQPQDGGNGSSTLSSPLVRRLATEHDVDLSTISGSGEGGRVTREDVEAAIGSGGDGGGQQQGAPAQQEAPAAKQDAPERRRDATSKASPQPQRRPTPQTGDRTRVEDLSRIRQRIAAKMMESLESSAQLTTVQEVDVTRVMSLRSQIKDEFSARESVSLSPFVFLCRAAVLAIRNHPKVNAYADWNAGKVTFHEYVNLGIAVDTDKGLLVPNVKGADDLSLAGLARAINEVAGKARGKGKLEMQDIEGGTFTITNTGSVGVLIDTPILNYPEVAILGTGAVRKRAAVISDETGDALAIRDMAYLSLTYDHRLIDGADAARFVTEVAEVVETHDWAQEIGYGSA
ncbi:MAG: 2-oxoglutarate dehydrogenase, E2 component, dihydrolipoamide succinyltransferase [Actinomycetota bacterium]|nr:2-oxoglutarate dehydrogenase, E2 component, dihydrolipoamide succinyltransferase [Actinomycetota bacterium]